MHKKIFPLIAVVLLTSSCSLYQVTSYETSDDYFPSKKSPSDVAYLATVDQDHTVIGDVVINTERRQRLDDVIEKMKQQAAVMGGDAITDLKTDSTGTWKKLPAQDLLSNGYVRANFTATVVVLNQPKKTSEPQTPPEN